MGRLPIEKCTATTVTMDGRDYLAFGGCNYLGLGYHPAVTIAIAQGLTRFGISTTASRETTGNTTPHEELEHELAQFCAQEASILTADGYTANFAACEALAPDIGIVLMDQQAHRSIRSGATAVGMQVFEYEHLDAESARWLVRQHADVGVAIMTDSVFAADGAIAPLPELLAILPPRRSCLLVDDCHGFCVLGPQGRGSVPHFELDDPRIVITTTLAKGLGCYGGAILGREGYVKHIRDTAAVYRNSTPVPPAIAEGCRSALRIMRDDPSLVEQLHANINAMRRVFTQVGFPLPPPGIPIFTFTLSPIDRMQSVHEALLDRGILAPLIEYPGGPSARYFRVVVTGAHSEDDVRRFGESIRETLSSAR